MDRFPGDVPAAKSAIHQTAGATGGTAGGLLLAWGRSSANGSLAPCSTRPLGSGVCIKLRVNCVPMVYCVPGAGLLMLYRVPGVAVDSARTGPRPQQQPQHPGQQNMHHCLPQELIYVLSLLGTWRRA